MDMLTDSPMTAKLEMEKPEEGWYQFKNWNINRDINIWKDERTFKEGT